MKYYVCNTASRSGIARYAEDFFKCVLEEKGYTLISPAALTAIFLSQCDSETRFFFELGAGQYAEKKALLLTLQKGFKASITLHDPPFVNFPYLQVKGRVLNKLSRGIDWYFNTFGLTRAVLKKCETIYVLSRKGEKLLHDRFGALNTKYIPHVVSSKKISKKPLTGDEKNIMFFGFIGRGKGLDYALQIHSLIVRDNPEVEMHVVGEAADQSAKAYLECLKKRYKENVNYHGYVPEERLDALFASVAHVFLPFYEYKYVCPTSGSVISALRRGKIVWTNPVNSVPELIEDGRNGVFFRNDPARDVGVFKGFIENPHLAADISRRALMSVRGACDTNSYLCVE